MRGSLGFITVTLSSWPCPSVVACAHCTPFVIAEPRAPGTFPAACDHAHTEALLLLKGCARPGLFLLALEFLHPDFAAATRSLAKLDFSVLVLSGAKPGLPLVLHATCHPGLTTSASNCCRSGFCPLVLDLAALEVSLPLHGFSCLESSVLVMGLSGFGPFLLLKTLNRIELATSAFGSSSLELSLPALDFSVLGALFLLKGASKLGLLSVACGLARSDALAFASDPSTPGTLLALRSCWHPGVSLLASQLGRMEALLPVLDLLQLDVLPPAHSSTCMGLAASVLDPLESEAPLALRSFIHVGVLVIVCGISWFGLIFLASDFTSCGSSFLPRGVALLGLPSLVFGRSCFELLPPLLGRFCVDASVTLQSSSQAGAMLPAPSSTSVDASTLPKSLRCSGVSPSPYGRAKSDLPLLAVDVTGLDASLLIRSSV